MSRLDDAPEIIVVLGGGLLPDGSPDAAPLRSTLEGLDDGDLAGMFERIATRWPEYAGYASRVR